MKFVNIYSVVIKDSRHIECFRYPVDERGDVKLTPNISRSVDWE